MLTRFTITVYGLFENDAEISRIISHSLFLERVIARIY